MSESLEKILKDIQQGHIPPYLVVHGDDELLVTEAAQKIAAAILPDSEREFNFDVLDGKELDFSALFSLANTYPFLKERRLVVVKEAYFFTPKEKDAIKLTPEAKKRFADTKEVTAIFKEEPPPFSTIIFTASYLIKNTDPLLKLILKYGVELAFVSEKKFIPQTDKTYLLAQEKLAALGKKIELKAYQLLLEKCGNNSRLIFDELEKISIYLTNSSLITEELVATLVTRVSEENIFGFQEHITTRQHTLALSDLARLREDENRPEIILFLLIQNFRWLNQLKLISEEGMFKKFKKFDYNSFQNDIIPALKEHYAEILPKEKPYNVLLQHPFVVFKNYQASLKFQLLELRKIMEYLETLDIGTKTSAIDLWLGLENLILMASGQPYVHVS